MGIIWPKTSTPPEQRLNIKKIAKFESDASKADEDTALQSRQLFMGGVGEGSRLVVVLKFCVLEGLYIRSVFNNSLSDMQFYFFSMLSFQRSRRIFTNWCLLEVGTAFCNVV